MYCHIHQLAIESQQQWAKTIGATNDQCIQDVLNSLAPGRFEWNFVNVLSSVNDAWGISCETAVRWMSLNLTDDKSTLVQAWCRQATSHYLSQCWPRSLSTYGVTRPQWVNIQSTDNVAKGLRAVSIWSCRLTGIGIPIIKIRQSHDRLIRIMEIPIQGLVRPFLPIGLSGRRIIVVVCVCPSVRPCVRPFVRP